MKSPDLNHALEVLWHVTVLSNFARGFDKYSRIYSKAEIPESTFPNQFYLLREHELASGIAKARGLLQRLALPGNRLLALRARVHENDLHANTRTGIGRFVERSGVRLEGVAWVIEDISGHQLEPAVIEEAIALSHQLLCPALKGYDALQPRTFSVLPIARGCQASCPFCFSEASASAEQEQAKLDLPPIRQLANAARERGADRFVITGGGEPGLVRHEKLCDLIQVGSESLGKVVLITNGHHLAKLQDAERSQVLSNYHQSGLRVLAISRHHHDDETSSRLMSLPTDVSAIVHSWQMGRTSWPELRLRFTCVLQRGGVDSQEALEAYVGWAASLGVSELCFKELYVSTSAESVYHRHAANEWSLANQVPLELVLDFASRHKFVEIARLPWGAPVFHGSWRGHPMQIAAYTEPSLFWERSNGIARSWNLMADGRCLVSLEDRDSQIELPVP